MPRRRPWVRRRCHIWGDGGGLVCCWDVERGMENGR